MIWIHYENFNKYWRDLITEIFGALIIAISIFMTDLRSMNGAN